MSKHMRGCSTDIGFAVTTMSKGGQVVTVTETVPSEHFGDEAPWLAENVAAVFDRFASGSDTEGNGLMGVYAGVLHHGWAADCMAEDVTKR